MNSWLWVTTPAVASTTVAFPVPFAILLRGSSDCGAPAGCLGPKLNRLSMTALLGQLETPCSG